MKQLLILLLGVGLFMTSCEKDPELPTCIQEKLDTFELDATVCSPTAGNPLAGGNLVSFNFRAETVYCFNWGACNPDKTIEIWSEDCELICEMGGVNGVTICDGTPWEGNASEIDVLYQKS